MTPLATRLSCFDLISPVLLDDKTPPLPFNPLTLSSPSKSTPWGESPLLLLSPSPGLDLRKSPVKMVGKIADDPLSNKGCEDYYNIITARKSTRIRKTVYDATLPSMYVLPEWIKPSDAHKVSRIHYEYAEWPEDSINASIAVPSDNGLLLLAAYYEKKYGICILIVNSETALKAALLREGSKDAVSAWGIIATSNDPESSHVTPLLCLKHPSQRLQIAELDSMRNPCENVCTALNELLLDKTAPLEILKLNKQRQAAPFGCRTDALVILKDALRDLKDNHVDNLSEHLKAEGTAKSHQKKNFDLPSAWAKTVQISSALKPDLAAQLIGYKKQTLEEFRKRYYHPHPRTETYTVVTKNAVGPYEHELVHVKNEKIVNLFLNVKGKMHLIKIKQILNDADPDIAHLMLQKEDSYD